jgi:hypothetical protein
MKFPAEINYRECSPIITVTKYEGMLSEVRKGTVTTAPFLSNTQA